MSRGQARPCDCPLDYMKYPRQTQWVNACHKYKKRLVVYRGRTKLLTKLMFESKLIWMYFQSNSIPLAPTHRGRHLEIQNKTKTENTRITIINNLLQEGNHGLPWHHKLCCCPAHSSHHDLIFSFTRITRHYKMEAQQVCQIHRCLHKFLEHQTDIKGTCRNQNY